ncbi:MAG TPA: NUDIX domain-containing protein [Rhizomicrobium sp.]|nr:NUDIX domain-containing protein [Rhizomicrobium sp.]
MRERPTVRVLLLSPSKRLLMFRYPNRSKSKIPPTCWATAGGGIDPGETIAQAAAREVLEETGISGVTLGPVVWHSEDLLHLPDRMILLAERFMIAHAPNEDVVTDGWTEQERAEISAYHWWSLAEIRTTAEKLYPVGLARFLPPILEGDYPAEPLALPPQFDPAEKNSAGT